MTNELTIKDLRDYRRDEKVLYARRHNPDREIWLQFNGSIQVWHNGKMVLETTESWRAVEYFNDLSNFVENKNEQQ